MSEGLKLRKLSFAITLVCLIAIIVLIILQYAVGIKDDRIDKLPYLILIISLAATKIIDSKVACLDMEQAKKDLAEAWEIIEELHNNKEEQ